MSGLNEFFSQCRSSPYGCSGRIGSGSKHMIALATLISGIAILLIGFRLYILDHTSRTNQLFFLITILFTTLHICWYELETTEDVARAFFIKQVMGFWPVMNAFLFISFWFFAGMGQHLRMRVFTLPVLLLALLPGIFFWYAEATAVHPFGTYHLDSETKRWMLYYTEVDWLDIAMVIWRSLLFFGIVLLVLIAWKNTRNPYKRKWMRYMSAVVAFAVVVSMVQTVALPLYGVPSVVNEAFTTSVGIVFYSWAISGFRFLEIRPEMALDQIVGSMTNVLILLNPDGIIRSVNPAGERFFKLRAEDVVGQPMEMLFGDALDWALVRDHQEGTRHEIVLTVQGETRYLLLNLVPVYKRNKILSGFACLGTDLSAYKASERKVREGNIALRQSNLMLEEFIRSASHDFKEPLRTASIYASLLKQQQAEANQMPYHEGIKLALKRMDDLLDSMLEVSSLSGNTGKHRMVDLEKLLQRIQDRLRPIIDQRQGQVEVQVSCPVNGDSEKLELLFQHLLQNAFQHNDKEPLKVQVSCAQEGEGMVVTIQDDGHGIPANFQKRIFQLFRRSSSEYPVGQGLGVGLTVARLIAEQHGGSIDLLSSNEQGTQFRIWLPAINENQKKFVEALEV